MEEQGGESITQLADLQPQIDFPIRVLIPYHINAPARGSKTSRDEFIRKYAFSPKAYALSMQTVHLDATNKLPEIEQTAQKSDNEAKIKTQIHDYTMLAFSSHRAGKRDVEASAYISLGVIYDNMGKYKLAIDNYKEYLRLSKEIGDTQAQAIANNCLGVDYMFLARPPSDEGFLNGFQKTSENIGYIRQAIECHQQYSASNDKGSKFVSHVNLGLCHGCLGEIAIGAKHYQEALRIAIQLQTLYGQSIAVGNLGMLAINKMDLTTARTCFEQHLQLVQSLQDPEGEVNAWKLLAKLSSLNNNNEEAIELLEHARRVATKHGFLSELRRILCLMGIAKGSETFTQQCNEVVQNIQFSIEDN